MGKLAVIGIVVALVAAGVTDLLNADVAIIALGVFVYANIHLARATQTLPAERRDLHLSLALWSNVGIVVLAALRFFELVFALQERS